MTIMFEIKFKDEATLFGFDGPSQFLPIAATRQCIRKLYEKSLRATDYQVVKPDHLNIDIAEVERGLILMERKAKQRLS